MTTPTILGIDAGSRTVPEAEHLLHTVAQALGLSPEAIGCTHFVQVGYPHVACSITVPGPAVLSDASAVLPAGTATALADSRTGDADGAEGAARAAGEHESRQGGRVVIYPGRARLVGTLAVREVLTLSAIDRVAVLAQSHEPAPDLLIETNDYVRPLWREGRMTLLTMPAAGGRLMPAEVPNPTPCCADHA